MPLIFLRECLEHLRRTLEFTAEEMRPIGPGWLVRSPSLPLVWTLNQIRIREPANFGDVVALVKKYRAELPYRHIVVEDGSPGQRLEDAFGAAGWRVDREVLMTLAEAPDRDVDTSTVTKLSEKQMLALMRRWNAEDHPDISVDGLDQLEEYSRREGRLWKEQRFGIVDEEGFRWPSPNCARKEPRRGLRTYTRCPKLALVAMPACLSHTPRRSPDLRITT